MSEAITEDWLRACGFRWSQFERQPTKHWTLWMGNAVEDGPDLEDIGIELAPGYDGKWHCWFRSDMAGRYCRFVHIRYLRWTDEVTDLIAALCGRPFNPADVFYGGLVTPARADRYRTEAERLDRQILRSNPWESDGKDQSLAGARAEHLHEYENRRSEG